MSAYANSRHIVNPYVSTDNPIDTTAEGYYSLQQAYGRTSKNFKPSPGVYHNTRLGQRHKATDHQELHMSTVSSHSAQNSVSSRQPKQSSSGVYASLGQIDQDGVYQDLAKVVSSANFHQTSNSKPEHPSSSEAYVSVRLRDQENAYQEQALQLIGPTVRYHTREMATQVRQPLQMSGGYASIMGQKYVHNDNESTTQGITIRQHSNTNNLKSNTTLEPLATHEQGHIYNDVESPEVDNIYDEPSIDDQESDFTHRRERTGTILSESGRNRTKILLCITIPAFIIIITIVIVFLLILYM